MNTIPLTDAPAPLRTLARTLPPGWAVVVTAGHGTLERGGLSEDTDGEGRRSRTTRHIPVDSWALRAQHPDGRAVRIVWARREGLCVGTLGKKWGKAWSPVYAVAPTVETLALALAATLRPHSPSFTLAWRGRHPGEAVPVELNSREIAAYLAATTPAAALAAVDQVRAAQAAATAKAAATRAAKRGAPAEVLPFPTPDQPDEHGEEAA